MSSGVGELEVISIGCDCVAGAMTEDGVVYVGGPVKISFSIAAICLPKLYFLRAKSCGFMSSTKASRSAPLSCPRSFSVQTLAVEFILLGRLTDHVVAILIPHH